MSDEIALSQAGTLNGSTLNGLSVEFLKREDFPTLRQTYTVKKNWKCVFVFEFVDDYARIYLNGVTIAEAKYGEKVAVEFQALLNVGNNTLDLHVANSMPPDWSIKFQIYIFDETGQPKYPAISLNPSGKANGPKTVAYAQSFYFYKTE